MNLEPNSQQQKLIDSTDGIYLIDAGAGTGKTFTVTRRYVNILEKKDVELEDLLLVTFTENAAEEMKEKVINLSEGYSPTQVNDAPIQTFHSLCKRIVDERGFEAPKLLGLDERISSSTDIMENEVLEEQEFGRFFDRFVEDNPEYKDFYRIIFDSKNLLHLLKTLASKGIFPTREGWFKRSKDYLEGNFEKFEELFEEANEPKNDGDKQSDLRSRLISYGDKCFIEGAPEREEIRGGWGSKKISENFAEEAFFEDRSELVEFVRDLYFEYIRYSLGRNYLNFNFLMMFAYILVYEDEDLREKFSFEYLMIDEFQDTSEIQFKLALLLSETNNICAVGDWKQSIYSFQYADVRNIRNFEERISDYKEELNSDAARVEYPVEDVEKIPLKKNYRSTQKILDFSEQGLTLRGKQNEEVDVRSIEKDITSLDSALDYQEPTQVSALKSEEEKLMILEKIEEIVGNSDYRIEDGDDWKIPDYEDIVVLVRRSKFGLNLQQKAREFGVPLVYEGGTEIFKTDSAKILLAWLRLLDYEDSKRGWSVILENAGYTLDEVETCLENEDYPENMERFLEELRIEEDITSVARKVFNKYGISNSFSDKILEVLQSVFSSSYMNLGRIIQFIEDNIENGKSYKVDNASEKNLVKVRTIHAEKGLEHPIVFISDINRDRFPSTTGNFSVIDYEDPIGLRQKKEYSDENLPYVYDNWRTELLSKCLTGDYDEERRLMYVAMTRAKRYLFLTSGMERPSMFFEDLDIEAEQVEPELEKVEVEEKEVPPKFEIGEDFSSSPLKLSVHSLMSGIEGEGEGIEYGTKVHQFGESFVKGKDVEPGNADEENLENFLKSLEGELFSEKDCLLPLELESRKVTLNGSIDLINETEDFVKVVDYKTDRNRENEEEYVKQLSAYYHVLNEAYSDKDVEPSIFYTHEGREVLIDPVSKKELIETLERFYD